MPRQIPLFHAPKAKLSHGGGLGKGRRKVKRPLMVKKPLHLVLKSDIAVGLLSLWRKERKQKIENIIRSKAKENFIQILDAVNMGNHIHLKIRIPSRSLFQRFLRTITGLIARIILGADKGKPKGKFWDCLAFTRILVTPIEELQLRGYFQANRIEREKGYQARTEMLEKFNAWIRNLRARRKTKY